ncbi:Actin-related protein 5 [Oopsacas minuta]|uniref:Actin-related protein 5 n=1 Tax=Oopsacas minuta TaxID=111878 RepID=A0AAV7K786_9METZ|nr:Actin-related protein 5 [Oopsacas minuta]
MQSSSSSITEGALLLQNDIYFRDYSEFRDKGACLVIDNGSHKCRVGWSGDQDPRIVFPNVTARPRTKRTELENVVIVGNEIVNMESMRSYLKSQFERDIVMNFDVQEHVFDYLFSHMGVDADSVQVPVLLTETLCNPPTSRVNMTQLLFECYRVPKVAYGIDCLFSYRYNHQKIPSLADCQDCFIINSGTYSTHVIPILDGKMDLSHTKRINLGGTHTLKFMQKFLQLKYSQYPNSILQTKMQEVIENHSYIALDFPEELNNWRDPVKMQQQSYVYQLDMVDPAKKEEQERVRRRKLIINIQNKQLKEVEGKISPLYQRQLHLQALKEMDEESNALQFSLEREGISSQDELSDVIRDVEKQIDKLREKKIQILEKKEKIENPSASVEPEEKKYSEEELSLARSKRQELLDRITEREQLRSELNKRGSLANQQKTKLLNRLANIMDSSSYSSVNLSDMDLDAQEKKILDTMDDTASKRDQQEIDDIEHILKLYDPLYGKSMDPASLHQISIGIEKFRCPEVVFRPTMIGLDQTGIVDTIDWILKQYPENIQSRLNHNFFVTGGNTCYPGFCDRLHKDLTQTLPIHTDIKIHRAGRPNLDAWTGASWWAASNPDERFMTRSEYQEKGVHYFPEHFASNIYYPQKKDASSSEEA